MRPRLALLAFAGAALLGVTASAGGGVRAVENGRIVFAAESSDQSQFLLYDLQKRRLQSLPQADGLASPVISPNGKYVAFCPGPYNCANGDANLIWVAPTRKHGRRKFVAHGRQPSWSPGSRRLAFWDCAGYPDCWVATVGRNGKDFRRIYSGPVGDTSWSPTGQWVAFRKGNNPADLVVAHPDGSGAHIVASDVGGYAWSPTGQWIAFGKGDDPADLMVVHPDGSGAHVIARNTDAYAWSPDGTRVAFVSDLDIYVAPVSGGAATRLTHDSLGAYDIKWSPDGARIACDTSLGVRVIDLSGRVVHFFPDAAWSMWSSDGRQLGLFAAGGIEVARPDGTHTRLVLHRSIGSNYGDLAWVPHSQQISFTRVTFDDGSQLFSIRPDGSGKQRPSRAAIDPAVSPNGKLIAFSRVWPAGNREIEVMRADGSGVQRLTTNRFGWDYQPTWSPDGTRIAFVRETKLYGSGHLWVVRLATGKARLLSDVESPGTPAWSPNGLFIALEGSGRPRNSKVPGIRLLDLRTGSIREVTDASNYGCAFDYGPSWSPDGNRLAFVREAPCGSVFGYEGEVLDVRTGKQSPIGQGNSWVFGPRLSWSPDGRRIAATLLGDYGALSTVRPNGSAGLPVWDGPLYPTGGVSWGRKP